MTGTIPPGASDLETCADSCHSSATCIGIIYRGGTSTCYHLGLADPLCDYTKSDASVTIAYKIKKCVETNYTNADPFSKQYYGDKATVTCKMGYSLNEIVHTDNTRDASCSLAGDPNYFSDSRECTAVKCTYSATEPPNINENNIVSTTRHFPNGIDVSCKTGFVQRTDTIVYSATYPSAYTIACTAVGTFDSPDTCKGKPCTMPRPANTTAANPVDGLFDDPPLPINCDTGHHVANDENRETYDTDCQADGWTANTSCVPKLCSMPVPTNVNYASAQVAGHYPAVVDLTCTLGYVVDGTGTTLSYSTTCGDNGLFSPIQTCEKRECSIAKPAFITQVADPMVGLFEETHQMQCQVGYVLVGQATTGAGTANSYTTTCKNDGQWNDTTACTKIRCDVNQPDKVEAPPFNGVFEEMRTAQCIEGYRTLNSNVDTTYPTVCLATGLWNVTDICKKVHCNMSKPENTNHNSATVEGDYEESKDITCKSGYVLDGFVNTPTDNTYSTRCQATGTWSDTRACHRIECSTAAPDNVIVNGTEESPTTMTSHFEFVTTIDCIVGYVITGTSRDRNYTTVCQADAQFADTRACEKIRCDIQAPENLQETVANGEYEEFITLHCVTGYRILSSNLVSEYQTQCTASGDWSQFEGCREVICPELFPQYTQLEVNGTYEDEHTIECLEGHITTLDGSAYITADNYTSDEVIRNYTTTCEASGQWDKNLTCRRTFCKAPAFDNITQQDDPGTDYVGEYEDTKPVNCKTGYWTTDGRLRNYIVECGPWGFWLTNNCVKVTCVALEIEHAEVSPLKPIYLYEESVQVTCGDNYETEDEEQDYYTQCADSGNWTHSKKCFLKKCDDITLLNTNATNHTQAAGSTVLVTCAVGHKTEFGAVSFESSCSLNREWRNVHNCSRIYCKKLNVANTNTWDVYKQYEDEQEVVTLPGYENQFSNETMKCVCTADEEWNPKPIITPVRCEAQAPQLTTTLQLESFFPLSKLVYCNSGCSLNGSTSTNYVSQCNASALWSNLIACHQIWCTEKYEIGWRQALPRSTWGTHVEVECSTGYEASGGILTPSNYCGNGGHWTFKKCFKMNCPAFIVFNVLESNITGSYGKELHVKCHTGHQTVTGLTEYNSTCGANKAWSEVHNCWPRNCSAYSIPNTTVENMSGSFNQIRTGSCIAGHTITSTLATFELRCNQTGQWDHSVTVCSPVTCEPFLVRHSKGVKNSFVSGNFGDSVEVKCSIGYSLSDNVEQVTTYCNGSGNWNWTGTCDPVTCPQLTHDHSVEPTRALGNNTYGTIYEFKCTNGFSDMTTIGSNGTRCLTNGQWSPTPSCLPTCPTLDGIDYGGFSPREVKVNAQVIYTCDKGFHLIGNSVRKCEYSEAKRESQWSGTTPKCIETPIDGFWYPWSEWTRCTSTCDHGMHERERRCEPPRYGGARCVGVERQKEVCSEVPCPVDSSVEEWTPWTPCKVTCGLAFQTKIRHCVPAKHGGKPCDGHKDENNNKIKLTASRNCDIPECPISTYQAVTQTELQGQFKEADNLPMIKIASISIGCLFIGLVAALAVVLDLTGFLMKRHDYLQKTALKRAKRRIQRIPPEQCQ